MNRRNLLQVILSFPVFRIMYSKEKESADIRPGVEFFTKSENLGLGTGVPTCVLHIQGPLEEEILRIQANGEIIQNGKVINSDPDAVRDAFIKAANYMSYK